MMTIPSKVSEALLGVCESGETTRLDMSILQSLVPTNDGPYMLHYADLTEVYELVRNERYSYWNNRITISARNLRKIYPPADDKAWNNNVYSLYRHEDGLVLNDGKSERRLIFTPWVCERIQGMAFNGVFTARNTPVRVSVETELDVNAEAEKLHEFQNELATGTLQLAVDTDYAKLAVAGPTESPWTEVDMPQEVSDSQLMMFAASLYNQLEFGNIAEASRLINEVCKPFGTEYQLIRKDRGLLRRILG